MIRQHTNGCVVDTRRREGWVAAEQGDAPGLLARVANADPLTTQALATRTAEKIFQSYFDGSPWVTREAPVVSTARAVTRAAVARGL